MGENPEDQRIRRLLAGAAVFCAAVFVAAVLVCTILVATNFNLLQWLE